MFFAAAILVLSLQLFGFQGMAQNDSEEGNFGVTVSGSCSIYSPRFFPPGSDTFAYNNQTELTINVLAQNDTSEFYYSLVNDGNRNTTITHEIDIRRVETFNTSWEGGTEVNLSKQNVSYAPKEDNLTHFIPPEQEQDTAVGVTYLPVFKSFDAIYQPGNFLARLQANFSCSQSGNGTVEEYSRFRILDAPGAGGGVEQGDFPSNDPFPAQSNVTTDEPTNYTTPNLGGNDTSELDRPRDANQTGNFSTNVTIPEDANRTGEESDETVEGDNDNPGQTPEPEPEPEPTPGDSPQPGESDQSRLQIDVEPTNSTYTGYQGQYAPAELQIENIGEDTVTDISVIPEIGEIRPGWQVRNATVANLTVNETVERDVFVRPPEDQPPGRYLVPVRAQNPDQQLDLDYFTVDVKQSEFVPRVSIQESPRTVTMQTGANRTLPILVENPGRRNITNVTARLQNTEDCGQVTSSSVSMININESASMQVSVQASENAQTCEATLIVSSADGAYSFSDITFNVQPEEGLIPEEQRVPFIAILWTFVLAAYAILRKRYDLNSAIVKIPFILLLMGETVIILYMLVNYYGVMTVSFLPF